MAKEDQTALEDFSAFEAYCKTMGLDLEASPDSTMDPLRAALARTAVSGEMSSPSFGSGGESGQLPLRLDQLPLLSLREDLTPRKGLPTADMGMSIRATIPTEDFIFTPAVDDDGPPPDFRVWGVLGEGGMGVVQSAEQTALQRQVAIKRLKARKASSKEVKALLQEALLMGRLEHPNIIPVYGLGRDEELSPILVMQRIEGARWRDLLQDKWHPAWRDVIGDRLVWHVNTLMQVCNAVHFAHSKGVVHRDIKPENVMIGEYGEVFLLDWGIGVSMERRENYPHQGIAGTPAYMAPEMVKGGTQWISPKTDIYLLGATLHEILIGEPRHQGESLFEVMYSALHSEPYAYPEHVPRELAAICQKAMHVEPEERYEDVQALRRALADFLQHRAATELCDAAASRLETLHNLLSQQHSEPSLVARIYRLFHECRFALEQALDQWGDNPDALRLRQECLGAMVSFEIEQRNLPAARALLPELSPPQPKLEAACRALAESLDAERREHERLKDLARDLDPSVTRRERTIVGVALGIYFLVSVLFISWQRAMKGDDIFTHDKSILVSFLLLMGVSAATFLWRKTLFKNKFGRQMVHTVWVAILFVLLHRILGKILHMPLLQIMILDGLMIAAMATIAAIAYNPVFAFAGLIGSGAAFGAAIWYDDAYDILMLGILVALFVAGVWVLWRRFVPSSQERSHKGV